MHWWLNDRMSELMSKGTNGAYQIGTLPSKTVIKTGCYN